MHLFQLANSSLVYHKTEENNVRIKDQEIENKQLLEVNKTIKEEMNQTKKILEEIEISLFYYINPILDQKITA